MPTTWIVTGDASRARILQVTGQNRLEEIESFVNPKGRMPDRELTTDAHPRLRGTAGPGSDRQETGAAEHETEMFAKAIDRRLDLARARNRFDRLFLLAPPKFLGLLRQNLSRETAKLVSDDVAQNLAWFDPREVERYLRERRRLREDERESGRTR
jgi:protein required for attachment to host cells